MDSHSDDVVHVAAGTLVEMNELAEQLREAGISARVVGDNLTAGLGSTLPGSVELWVVAADAERAARLIAAEHAPHRKPQHEKFPHPESDPKPDRSRGPHPMPEPHRQSP